MNLPFYIAKRYLFVKKSHNVINIISGISVAGITIGSMALIIVLSVFNGFEALIISLFNSFDPEIKITVKEGKNFDPASIPMDKIKNINGILFISKTLEEQALLKYNDKQYIATIKGVDTNFQKMSGIDTMVVNGEFSLHKNHKNSCVIGYGIARYLSVSLNDVYRPITIYAPRCDSLAGSDPTQAFNSRPIFPTGIFSIQQDFDDKYLLLSLDYAREILEYPTEVSSIEIGIAAGTNSEKIQKEIIALVGDKYKVVNRFQQHDFLYKIMKTEKWAVFLILSFILVIAIFNVIGSLTMLIMEKKKDMDILKSMGASTLLIRKIFLTEGLMISGFGCILGLMIGAIICYIQQRFGIVQIQAEGAFVVSSYPVKLVVTDFIYVFTTVIGIGFVAVWLPIRQIK